MADELDALFGAFDGGGGGGGDNDAEGRQEKENETKMEEATATKDSPNDHVAKKPATTPQQQPTQDTKALYTNVMSASTSQTSNQTTTTTTSWKSPTQVAVSTKKEEDSSAGNDQKNDDSKKEDDKDYKEISTGTSHDKSVRSYSAYPKELPEHLKKKKKSSSSSSEPAKTYPFPLDPFQKQAVGYIEVDESVLVAAHTSAGKTAVAEYAVAKSLKAGQRVVYTSPIKALSNQKFRDLQEEFSDVGLMTGDITINPTATALVMTTEILRSMLYRGSELMREVAWVIYDEVHYMRDSERGVVWEESIILLPHTVRFVFLSATIPNANQFAEWIAAIHYQPCHVVYTNYRPVPLQHYIFPQGGEGLHLVVDDRGKFREANFSKAMATLQSSSSNTDAAQADFVLGSGNAKQSRKRKRSGGGGGKGGSGNDLHRIVKLVMDRNLNPVIVFSFSKKECERYALALKQEDYTDDVEKDLISQVYTNAIESLSEDDRSLPQVVALLPLLKRGIGIHHGGLLPILKEIVEILFSEGLLKALFATETFSIGINMPAKTVVFTNTRKWDGKDFRWLTSGEYIQMSGRAGRRGKDDRGIVIQMLDEKMEPAVCKGILYGDPDPLHSSYRISYNMLLNMMRVEDVDPEYLLRASFHQFQRQAEAPALVQQAQELEDKAASISVGEEHAAWVHQYHTLQQQLSLTQHKMKVIVRQPEYILKFLQKSGRFLDVRIDDESFGWGALLSCKKKSSTDAETGGSSSLAALTNRNKEPSYTLDVLLFCVDRKVDGETQDQSAVERSQLEWRGTTQQCRAVQPTDDASKTCLRIFTVGLDSIERISAVKLFIPQDTHSPETRKNVGTAIREVQKRFPEGVPLLDPVQDLKVQEPEFKTLLQRAKDVTERIKSHIDKTELAQEEREQKLQLFSEKSRLLEHAKVLRDEARSFESIALKDDLRKMKKVLRRLGHVDAAGVIQTKGRTACEINTANELVVVELIFDGVFSDLTVEQCVALLSCMTFDERNKDDGPDSPTKSFLGNPFRKLQEIGRTVAKASIACKIDLDEDEFVNKFNPGM